MQTSSPQIPYKRFTCSDSKMTEAKEKWKKGGVQERHLDICGEDVCISGFSVHLAVKETENVVGPH
jgi:hypothetical protein